MTIPATPSKLPETEESLEKFEKQHVKQVYEAIATHFSDTRYKPWPVVDKFLNELPLGSIITDIGCGNGKYLGVNRGIYTVGSDITSGLIKICVERNYEAMIADGSRVPFRDGAFDYSISIAVIHHFASPERRKQAIDECLRVIKKGGKTLIFVWAFEQETSRRKFEQQDVFVSWKMPKEQYGISGANKNESDKQDSTSEKEDTQKQQKEEEERDVTYQRYYHVFKKGELDQLVQETNMGKIIKSGYDRDNWYVIVEKL